MFQSLAPARRSSRRADLARRSSVVRRPSVEGMEGRRLLTGLVEVNAAYATEYGTGPTTMDFNVRLAAPTTSPVTVHYQTSDGTAVAGTDYVAASGTVTIPAGQTSVEVPVTILPDTAATQNLNFGFKLSGATNGIIIAGNTSGIITELNAAAPPTISIANSSVTRDSGGPYTMTFNLSLNYAYSSPVTVDVSTGNVTAIAGVDYQANSEVLTFAPGQTTAQFNVTVYGTTTGGTKLLTVNLSNAQTSTGAAAPLSSTTAVGDIYYA